MDKSALFCRAWEIAYQAATTYGYGPRAYLSQALVMAWAEYREGKATKVVLLTGRTYPARREIKRATGGVATFNYDESAYILPFYMLDDVQAVSKNFELEISIQNWDHNPFREKSEVEQKADKEQALRARYLRRAEYWENRATVAERRADEAKAKQHPNSADWAYITQPILVGHHSEKRHRRERDQLSQLMEKEMEFKKQAREFNAKAKRFMERAESVGGHSRMQRERMKKEEAKQALIEVGSPVFWWGNKGHVVKIFKNSYRVDFGSFVRTIGKGLVEYDPFGQKRDVPAPVRAFKKGDQVVFTDQLFEANATVTRVNSKTYTVEYFCDIFNKTVKRKVNEYNLSKIA